MDASSSQQDSVREDLERNVPQRRCISCRGNGRKVALLRFVVVGGQLVFDLRQKLPGRGYYVCAQRACLKKAFDMGLRRVAKRDPRELAPDVDSFIAEILPALRRRYEEYLRAGSQSHQLLQGADSVEKAAAEGGLACYVLATDASDSTRQKYEMNAQRKGLPCLGLLDRESYGRLFGKSERVVLGWRPGQLFEAFAQLEEAIRRLEGEQPR